MTIDWKYLEARLGMDGLEAFTEAEVRPQLDRLSRSGAPDRHASDLKSLTRSLSLGFSAFGLVFFLIVFAFPDVWWGNVLRFVLFPILFFGSFLIAAFFSRKTIARILVGTRRHFVEKSTALKLIAEKVGLTYVSSPGGAPKSLKMATRIPFLKSELSGLAEEMDRNGGHEDVIRAVVQSGLLLPDVYVFGSEKTREKYYQQAADYRDFQDGFEGEIKGVRFAALEWVERIDEGDDKFHLVLVMKAPYRLQGETHLRSRKMPWQVSRTQRPMEEVKLVPDTFGDHFRLRGSDQVEARTLFNPAVVERVIALAHGKPFRAVASGEHLVIDVVGTDRFNLIEMHTGVWSEDTIRQTYIDIAEMLELVREMAHAFMVRN